MCLIWFTFIIIFIFYGQCSYFKVVLIISHTHRFQTHNNQWLVGVPKLCWMLMMWTLKYQKPTLNNRTSELLTA